MPEVHNDQKMFCFLFDFKPNVHYETYLINFQLLNLVSYTNAVRTYINGDKMEALHKEEKKKIQ